MRLSAKCRHHGDNNNPAVALSSNVPTSLSSSDAKLVGVVITYLEYMPNFTSAGTPPPPTPHRVHPLRQVLNRQTVGHE